MKPHNPNNYQYLPKKRSIYVNAALILVRGLSVFLFLYLAYLFYEQTLRRFFDDAGIFTTFVLLWFVTAYVILPRVHRFLTKIYLPDYYIGRAKTGDGLLADPINLAVFGDKEQLKRAMQAAGWIEADPITVLTVIKVIFSSLLRRPYPSAPISSLMLFGGKQDLAFQKEVPGSLHSRHHVRFWRVPSGWLLPGGHAADWLGAATFDKSVGFSLFTGQITHKIEAEIDQERDFVVASLVTTGATVEVIEHFNTAYHHRNGGGDSIRTDGSMPFVRL